MTASLKASSKALASGENTEGRGVGLLAVMVRVIRYGREFSFKSEPLPAPGQNGVNSQRSTVNGQRSTGPAARIGAGARVTRLGAPTAASHRGPCNLIIVPLSG